MATFKDKAGREWVVVIDTWQIRQVRERVGFEIGKILDENMRRWKELTDPVLLGSILFVLCHEQAEKAGVTERQFHEGLAGDPLDEAYEAFKKAYLDFSPSRLRTLLAAADGKTQELQDLLGKRALEELETVTPDRLISAISNASVGTSPASPESIPAG